VACTNNAEPAARRCVPQPAPAADPADQLDALRSRLMFRAPYRNRAGTESVMLNITVAGTLPVKAAIRWFEVQLQSGTPTIVQQGVFQPDTTNRFMGSIAMDASGNVALGYSRSARSGSPVGNALNVIPELDITGRLASDPLGTLSGETLIQAGGGIQTGTNNRWGDYSYMAVDPATAARSGSGRVPAQQRDVQLTTPLGTASFAPANCAPESQGTITGTVTYAENGAGAWIRWSTPEPSRRLRRTPRALHHHGQARHLRDVRRERHPRLHGREPSPNVNVVNGVPTVRTSRSTGTRGSRPRASPSTTRLERQRPDQPRGVLPPRRARAELGLPQRDRRDRGPHDHDAWRDHQQRHAELRQPGDRRHLRRDVLRHHDDGRLRLRHRRRLQSGRLLG
jgi:hypothetical protein